MAHNPLDALYEARRENLRTLAHRYDGPVALARKLSIGQSYMSQLIGKTPSKTISERTARNIETKLRLPAGWLDVVRVAP